MALPPAVTEMIVKVAKDHLLKIGKKVAYAFADSVTGKKLGELISYRQQDQNNNVVLFVHGFSGSASETFGKTPEMLDNNPQFAGWDIFSIGYSSDIFPSIGKGLWSVNPDITKISLYLRTLLKNQFNDYSRVAFVAHSMGGLAVQRAILDLPKPNQNKISHVLLFGTPSAGLKKAFWVKFWNTQLKDLSSQSEFIKKLRADWKTEFSTPPFNFKSIAGSKDEFVPIKSSLTPFEESYHGVIEGNHITMIKPKDENDTHHQSYEIISKTLTNRPTDYLRGNPEDINLLLGNYQSIINSFLPNVESIGLRELIQLVFALECRGRNEEAISILKNHKKASQNSDALGILAGRYKRKYLLQGLQKDFDNAFHFYKKALQISKQEQNQKQIFYHAINLAFMSIVGDSQDIDMRTYAQMALDSCISEHKDMWELATIAESNLYLGNLDIAKDFYKKSADVAGTDIRAKQSIYSNAFNGYQALMASQDKNASFLKMLEAIFLK